MDRTGPPPPLPFASFFDGSFYAPVDPDHVIERIDPKDSGMPKFLQRMEVLDRKSGTHLGHGDHFVFSVVVDSSAGSPLAPAVVVVVFVVVVVISVAATLALAPVVALALVLVFGGGGGCGCGGAIFVHGHMCMMACFHGLVTTDPLPWNLRPPFPPNVFELTPPDHSPVSLSCRLFTAYTPISV